MSLPPVLSNRLHNAFLRCSFFTSNQALEAAFVDTRINQWAEDLPEATSDGERVRATIKYLLGKRADDGKHALVLLLCVLSEQMPPTDARHQELTDLADELEREFELHPPQPEAPETFGQKVVQFVFGDTEAQRAYRNRQAMLKLVHNTWIKGVLEQSLHGAALIELGMEYDPAAVDHPWDMVVQMPERPDKQLPPGTRIVDVFDNAGGSLLILGEPGSGKTTMLLELARDLIARAEEDDTLHIPVVFNLSSWAVRQAPLDEWLIEELFTKYYIPKKVAQAWVKEDTLLLLLDGLDEVKAEAREKCLTAIDSFRKQHFVPLLVCSRIDEYQNLTKQLHLQSALCIQPLTSAQIEVRFADSGLDLKAIRDLLRSDLVLQEMTHSPLFLSVMILAYKNKDSADLQILDTQESRRQHLFNAYIEQMLQRRAKNIQPYTDEQMLQWLVWLANKITGCNQSVFLMESIQPEWLERTVFKSVFKIISVLAVSTFIGFTIVFPNIMSDLALLVILLPRLLNLNINGFYLFISALASKTFGIISRGIAYGAIMAIMLDMDIMRITSVQKLKWSWRNGRKNLLYGLIFGLFIGLIITIVGKFYVVDIFVFCSAVAACVLYGAFWGIGKSLVPVSAEAASIPNQGILHSFKNAVRVGVISGTLASLMLVLPVAVIAQTMLQMLFTNQQFALLDIVIGGIVGIGLYIGLYFGMRFGGFACIQHFTLRAILHKVKYLPFRLVPFLDHCVDRIFLRHVGGGYIFVHRLLQEHFASLTPEDIERIAGDSHATA